MIDNEGTATYLDKKKPTCPLPVPGRIVKVSKTYWVHQKHKDFKRRAMELHDEDSKRLPFVLLEYRFDGKEHEIKSERHKNAKQERKEFLRTKPSVLLKLKSEVKSRSSVATVYDQTFEDTGGVVNFQSRADLPRNLKQVSNLKNKTSSVKKEKDELYAVLEKTQKDEVPFVRQVQLTPNPACVLASMQSSAK